MNNLDSINETYIYLSEVYSLTKSDYVKERLIKTKDLKGLNPKSLVKHNFLTEYNETYKWKSLTPQYFHAYNYYNAVRGIKKTYEDILKVLNNPETYEIHETIEALKIKGACTLHNPETNEVITTYNNEVIDISQFEVHKVIPEPEIPLIKTLHSEKSSVDNEMLKDISNKFDLSLADNKIIKELLGDMVKSAIDNNGSIKNSQNSISTIIAILKTVQDNAFDNTASNYYILRELYASLLETHPNTDDPKIKDRIDKIGVAMQKTRERVDNNVAIVNKYGGKR
jgi:hypothetical protein